MPREEPSLSQLTQLVDALQRLNGDALVARPVTGDETRERVRDSIQRLQAALTIRAIDQFTLQQADTVADMFVLLDLWADMLAR